MRTLKEQHGCMHKTLVFASNFCVLPLTHNMHICAKCRTRLRR